MQLRESSTIKASNVIVRPDTSHVWTLSKVYMADSTSSESSSISGSNHSNFGASMGIEKNKRAYEPVG